MTISPEDFRAAVLALLATQLQGSREGPPEKYLNQAADLLRKAREHAAATRLHTWIQDLRDQEQLQKLMRELGPEIGRARLEQQQEQQGG